VVLPWVTIKARATEARQGSRAGADPSYRFGAARFTWLAAAVAAAAAGE